MLNGIQVYDKKVLRDDRGAVLHMLKNNSEEFHDDFGEIYFSKIRRGVIKGWKQHLEMTQRIAVPYGKVKFVFFDPRENSETFSQIFEITLSEDNYKLVVIPPKIIYSFEGQVEEESLIANCSNMPHSPEESRFIDLTSSKIPYSWHSNQGKSFDSR